MLAHGLRRAGELAARGAQVGITLNLYAIVRRPPTPRPTATRPAASTAWPTGSSSTRCCSAATRRTSSATSPAVSDFGFVRDGDLETIAAPLDMLGINYYSRHVVAGGPAPSRRSRTGASPPPGRAASTSGSPTAPACRVTAMDWEIDAPGLREVLQRVRRRLPGRPAVHHRERRGLRRQARPTARVARPGPRRLLRRAPAGVRRGRRRRGAAARVLRLVVDGQLRVGLGVHPPVRPGVRRLRRRPAPRPQGQRRMVRRPDPAATAPHEPPDPRRGGRPRRRGPGHRVPGRERVGAGQPAGPGGRPAGDRRTRVRAEPGRPRAGDPAHRLGGAGRLRVGGAGLRRAVLRRHRAGHQRRTGADAAAALAGDGAVAGRAAAHRAPPHRPSTSTA